MSYFERELPPKDLIQHEAWEEFQNFGVQWSKLVAWSWTDLNEAGSEEPTLKTSFITCLQQQAQDVESYVKCTTPEPPVVTRIDVYSRIIKALLLGESPASFRDQLPDEAKILANINLTLSEVLKKYTDQPLMTTREGAVKTLFSTSFNVRVITDSFVGRVTYALEKGATSPPEDKYILELAYPPRPVYSSATLKENTLQGWLKTNDDNPIKYATPPSCYVPWSAT